MGMQWLYGGRRVCAPAGWLLLALLLAAGEAAWAGHAVDKTLSDLVAEAERIEVVRLESKSSRWNQRGNLIVTDMHFRRERDLLGNRGAGERFTLSQGGGVIGNEGHKVSGNPDLQSGTRYLVFVDVEQGELFSPFVAGEQGVYRLDDDGTAHSLAGLDSVHAVRRAPAEAAVRAQALEQQRAVVPGADVGEHGLERRDQLELVDVGKQGQHDAGGVRGAVGVHDGDPAPERSRVAVGLRDPGRRGEGVDGALRREAAGVGAAERE